MQSSLSSVIQASLLSLAIATPATAGNVLFVNYNTSDAAIPAALAADGHIVTTTNVQPGSANAYFESVDLSPYCAVVWSTAYQYNQDLGVATSRLSAWASAGGSVLITAPDGIRSSSTFPNGQPDLVALLGGAGATDNGSGFSPVANALNSVTTGLIDIRGQVPPPISDMDALCGPLSADTVGLVTAQNTHCPSGDGYAWTLRTLGAGRVAFITSGNFGQSTNNDPDWAVTTIPGDGVYNAGLRNFVRAACTAGPSLPPPTPVPTTSAIGLLLGSLLLFIAAAVTFRSRRAKA
jgi:hypothetical protein